MINIKNLDFCYQDVPVIHAWSSQLDSGVICHLRGSNGSGKSTLLKLIAGILKPSAGSIETSGGCAYVGHQLGLHQQLSVLENLMFGLGAHVSIDWGEHLKQANLLSHQHRLCRELSLGQQHKVAMLGLLAKNAELWLLDEPFANLDHKSEEWLWDLIIRHQSQGGMVVFTAHQRDFRALGAYEWQI